MARFSALPGHRDAVRDLLMAYAGSVRSEPGAELFAPTTSSDDDHAFVVFERYADEAAFQAHLSAPENDRFNEQVRPHLAEAVTLQFLDALDA